MKRQGKLIKDIREGQIKKAGQDASWIQNLVKRSERVADPKDSPDSLRMKAPEVKWGDGLCVDCKGGKFLCGKTRCPLVIRLKYYFKTLPLIQGKDIDGASPPSVFVGRFGYPHVYAGPLVPPIHEDTSSYDLPELWFGKSIDEIVAFRSMLVRGKHRVHVKRFEEAGRIMDRTLELALSESSVDAELLLKRRPTRKIALD
ncbi:hypothetical protein GWN63_01745, partial [Candidatus Bathyarchaeota archaeon]|nr:hypothetical protein [Candidatus Bathyarchaeota archaeon]NIR12457.1 hypothetical protein [Desulfobacterales bacterium]NIU80959.1 hypothetical protein [Candidatus Bathyarchaeota archaeon]NIV67904.1 hypothetical protein [Candidatus Bathyarchaeota archaeon]NIW33983.1 hypothetical protein [Candidatus Bathyarchaeota archaeon]